MGDLEDALGNTEPAFEEKAKHPGTLQSNARPCAGLVP
jgi:hypothetical protein